MGKNVSTEVEQIGMSVSDGVIQLFCVSGLVFFLLKKSHIPGAVRAGCYCCCISNPTVLGDSPTDTGPPLRNLAFKDESNCFVMM